MNFIQFWPLVTKCLTFVAAGPWWLVRKVRRVFFTRWNYPMAADGISNSVRIEWSFCFFISSSSLGCFHVGMLWNAIQWPTSGPWWVCQWLLGQHHTHQHRAWWKQIDKNACVTFCWKAFPTKIWFYVHRGRGLMEAVVCGRGWLISWQTSRDVESFIQRSGVRPCLVPGTGPPCHLLALNHRVRLRICRAIQCPADRPVYSPSEWSQFSGK